METPSKTAAPSPAPVHIDLEFTGQGVYFLSANTPAGVQFIVDNVGFEPWQGSPEEGIAIDGARMAREIAEGAAEEGLLVEVSGERFSVE